MIQKILIILTLLFSIVYCDGIPLLDNGDDVVDSDFEEEVEEERKNEFFSWNGFIDVRYGHTFHEREENPSYTLAEIKSNVSAQFTFTNLRIKTSLDFKYNRFDKSIKPNFEDRTGVLDLRELYLSYSPLSFVDIKAGRQPLTWGTGDLLFINDIFPKDWKALLTGKRNDYLKIPSDAFKLSLFNKVINIDLVYIPKFQSDKYVDGSVLMYYNPQLKKVVGKNTLIQSKKPSTHIDNGEFALRLFRTLNKSEIAFYGYKGFWKTPEGIENNQFYHPELWVTGFSLRAPLLKGLVNVEYGHLFSSEDTDGGDPFLKNSEDRILIGYEKEIIKNFTASVQYYLEIVNDYDDYLQTLPAGTVKNKEAESTVTLRLMKYFFNKDLTLSLFTFYSFSHNDTYIRPKVSYRVNDKFSFSSGGNFFVGKSKTTFWGQFTKSSNIYGALELYF